MTAPSFPGAWDRYRRYLQVDLGRRQSTLRQYRVCLYAFDRFLREKGKQWDKATPHDLAKFLALPSRDPRNPGGTKAANTRAAEASCICSFYRFSYVHGLLGKDRMRAAIRPRTAHPVPRALDLPDIQDLLAAAADDQRMQTCLWLMYGCGLRSCEVAAARVEHVRLRGDPPTLYVPPSKSDRDRVVPLAPPVASHLRRVLAAMASTGPLVENRLRPGDHITRHTVSVYVSKFMRANGVKESSHALRHSFATHLLAAGKGANLLSVSRALGHASTEVTEQTYTSGYLGDMAGLAAALPDPRAGNGKGVADLPTLSGLAALVPVDVRDQLAAAVATLERYGPEVARAAETLPKMTTKAWLATLGLSEPSQLASLHAGDPRLDHTDQEWDDLERQLGIRKGWDLAYALRDAIDE